MGSIDRYTPFALFAVFAASLGGFLMGYHSAIISGILMPLKELFQLTLFQEGFVVSILLLGGLFGALLGGSIADRWGRKRVLLITASILVITSLIIALSTGYFLFIAGRFLSGMGVGIMSVVAPLYLAEIAPPHYRGRFVSFFQIMTAAGIFAAYGVNAMAAVWHGWRVVFWLSTLPAILQVVAVASIPETPGWLFRAGKSKKANQALAAFRKDMDWSAHLSEMQRSAKQPTNRAIWNKKVIFIVCIGVLLSIFQQITGINTIIFYAPKIFSENGFVAAETALIATLVVGIANLIMSLVAMWLIDRVGRRILLLVGTLGMALSLGILVVSFNQTTDHLLSIFSVVSYVCFFAMSLGPVTWVVLSEIFPLRVRGISMGLALFANWLFNYLVSQSFLNLIDKWGIQTTFIFFTALSLFCFLFVFFFIRETKGRSLEEIEKMQ